MSLAIIDAREWQNQFDLETGQKRPDTGPVVDMVKQVLSRHPYPGDMNETANEWVSQTALDLIDSYQPDLVCLSYVQQFFASRHFPYTEKEQENMFKTVMAEAFNFVETSGYTPVIIGTGGMTALKGEMDLSGLDGLAISSNWSARYCGLHDSTPADFNRIEQLEGIERIAARREWIDLFKSEQPDLDMDQEIDLMPDYLLVAKQGFGFKTMGTTLRKPRMIPANNFSIPVYTPLGRVEDLRGIKNLILSHLNTHKIALILVEGLGKKYFPDAAFLCSNGPSWFCYEPGDAFYLTLSTGKHQPFAYPAGYRFFDQDTETVKFPFSGYIRGIPDNTLAKGYPGRSIAVGNRSMYMHMVFWC